MASFESNVAWIIDKFNEGNFNLWKFKIQMLLASIDFWDTMDQSKEAPSFNVDPNVLKEYQKRLTNVMHISMTRV